MDAYETWRQQTSPLNIAKNTAEQHESGNLLASADGSFAFADAPILLPKTNISFSSIKSANPDLYCPLAMKN